MNTYDWAQNTLKLRRIIDKMPNASEAEIKAEYIKNGGLLNKVENPFTFETETIKPTSDTKPLKKSVAKAVKDVVKKVTKK